MTSRYLKLGTIADRHQLPVGCCLVHSNELYGLGGGYAYTLAYQRAREFPFDAHSYTGVELYYTGYTPVTLGALDGFAARGVECVPMCYDHATRKYFRLQREIIPAR